MREVAVAVLVTLTVMATAANAGIVVTDGLGVTDVVPTGWTVKPGGIRYGYPIVEAVDREADGVRELMTYAEGAALILGAGLDTLDAPGHQGRGVAAVIDATGDGLGDYVVADRARLRIVDAALGIVVAEAAHAVDEVYDVTVVPSASGAHIVTMATVGGGSHTRLVASSLPDLTPLWTVEVPGTVYVWDTTEDGTVMSARQSCFRCPSYLIHHVTAAGTLAWTVEEPTMSYAAGWYDGGHAWWLRGNDAVIIAAIADGTTTSEIIFPSDALLGTTAMAAVGDVNRDGKPDLAIADGTYKADFWQQNILNGRLWFLDGATQTLRPIGKLEGLARHLAVEDVDGDGWPDVVAATVTGAPASALPSSTRFWYPQGLVVSAASVSKYSGPELSLDWARLFTGGGVLGWQHVYHRGLTVADVGPGNTPAIAVARDWAGALDLLDPHTGATLAHREFPANAVTAEESACGITVGHMSGHVTLGNGNVGLVPDVPIAVAASDDCGAYVATPGYLARVEPTGELAWAHPASSPMTDLEADGDAVIAYGVDGFVSRVTAAGDLDWITTLGQPEVTNMHEAFPDGDRHLVATCVLEWGGGGAADAEILASTVASLDPVTGDATVLFEGDENACIHSAGFLDGDFVFLMDDTLTLLDTATDTVLWSVPMGAGVMRGFPLDSDSYAVLGDPGSAVSISVVDASGAVIETGSPAVPAWNAITGMARWGGADVVYAWFDKDLDQTMIVALDGTEKGRFHQDLNRLPEFAWGQRGVPWLSILGGCVPSGDGMLCWGGAGDANAIRLVPDTAPPSPTVGPLATSYPSTLPVTIEGTVTDDVGLAHAYADIASAVHQRRVPVTITGTTWRAALGLLPALAPLEPYTIDVTFKDTAGRVSVLSRTFSVEDAGNIPPTAAFRVTTANPVTWLGVRVVDDSTDPDGIIVRRTLTAGGFTFPVNDKNVASVIFRTPGTHTIRLEVEDNEGATSVVEQTVVVANRVPSIILLLRGAHGAPIEGEDAFLDFRVYDADTDLSSVSLMVDGAPVALPPATGRYMLETIPLGIVPAGGITAAVVAEDSASGIRTSAPSFVVASNQAPTAAPAADPIDAPGTVTLDGRASRDPEGRALTALWTTPWGTFDTLVATVDVAAMGAYPVTLTVTDPSGASTTTAATVHVDDALAVTAAIVAGGSIEKSPKLTASLTRIGTTEPVTVGGIRATVTHLETGQSADAVAAVDTHGTATWFLASPYGGIWLPGTYSVAILARAASAPGAPDPEIEEAVTDLSFSILGV